MKKGYISAHQLGFLNGASKAISLYEKVQKEHGVKVQRGTDVSAGFYATVFQAGIDHFVLPQHDEWENPSSKFLVDRISFTPKGEFDGEWKAILEVFSHSLPKGWLNDREYEFAKNVMIFISDLLHAMRLNTSLISSAVPDGSEISEISERLPAELAVPISNLLSSFSACKITALVPVQTVERESINRFNDIILSDLFANYSNAQASLDHAEVAVRDALPDVEGTAKTLFKVNKALLGLRKSGVVILGVTPKLLDAVFGKLPGAIGEIAIKIGADTLEARRRVAVYNFQEVIMDIMIAGLHKMHLEAEKIRKS